MRPPLRIAVLECDKPAGSLDAKYNGYYGVFSLLLRESAEALRQPDRLDPTSGFDISRWDVVTKQEYPNLEDVDAILLTGSKHNSYDNHPWIIKLVEYTRKAIEHDRVKILGICFGHQIIARASGMKVGKSGVGWEIAVCDMDLSDQGKEVFGKEKLRIQQMHQDIVFDCPPNAICLGSSPQCAIQGMYLPGHYITVQGHPEFRADMATEIIGLRMASSVFSKEIGEEALTRAANEHDGIAIMATFLDFLLDVSK